MEKLEFISVYGITKANITKSSDDIKTGFMTSFVNKFKRMSGSTEGWLVSSLEENEYPPKPKYIRYLVIKAWTKPFKI